MFHGYEKTNIQPYANHEKVFSKIKHHEYPKPFKRIQIFYEETPAGQNIISTNSTATQVPFDNSRTPYKPIGYTGLLSAAVLFFVFTEAIDVTFVLIKFGLIHLAPVLLMVWLGFKVIKR